MRSIGRLNSWDHRASDAARPTEARFNHGSREYVLTLPLGEYEVEDDAAADLTRINRIGPRDAATRFVCAVTRGTYEIDNDAAGAHLHRIPDDENVRIPLETGDAHGAMLTVTDLQRHADVIYGRQASPPPPIRTISDLVRRGQEIFGGARNG